MTTDACLGSSSLAIASERTQPSNCHNGFMTQAEVRRYKTGARSTETFGRVLVSARDQHLIVDGPVQNGCPGEAITPAELFLSGVAACGVELIQVLAKGLASGRDQDPQVSGEDRLVGVRAVRDEALHQDVVRALP